MRSSLLAVLLAAATAACGPGNSGGSQPPPPDGGGNAGGGAGGGSSAGGGASGGDQPSTGGSGGSGGGGSAGGASGGGGSGSGGVGQGPVTSPDGTVLIERADAAAECDGLVPASAPSAVTAPSMGAPPTCGWGISEGGGHVAVQMEQRQWLATWQVVSPAATVERTIDVAYNGSAVAAPRPFMFPQLDGWVAATMAVWAGGPVVEVDVEGLLPDGTPRGNATRVTPTDGQILSWAMVEDPRGGVAFVQSGAPASGPACAWDVMRFDASGAPRGGHATFDGHAPGCAAIAAVSHEGETFVVEKAGDAAWLRWVGADGAPVTPPAQAGAFAALFASGQPVALAPLLDGSIVAQEAGAWTRRFPHLGDHAEAPPAWLASRPGFTFRNTRGERGYALFPPGGETADCAQRIEVLAPSGRLCGTVTLSDPGGACRTRGVDQGWDGTVVQQSGRDACAWRWWPRLLGP